MKTIRATARVGAMALAATALAATPAQAQKLVPQQQQWALKGQPAPVATAATPDAIRAQASRIGELRQLLADRDPSTRYAAFDKMTDSSDPAAQELAYDAAFSSAEGAMRALALRKRLMHMATVTVEITDVTSDPLRSRHANAGQEVYIRVASTPVVGTDEANGVLVLSRNGRPANAEDLRRMESFVTISGLNVGLKNVGQECDGTLRLDDTNTLVGSLSCRGLVPGDGTPLSVKGRIRLN